MSQNIHTVFKENEVFYCKKQTYNLFNCFNFVRSGMVPFKLLFPTKLCKLINILIS